MSEKQIASIEQQLKNMNNSMEELKKTVIAYRTELREDAKYVREEQCKKIEDNEEKIQNNIVSIEKMKSGNKIWASVISAISGAIAVVVVKFFGDS